MTRAFLVGNTLRQKSSHNRRQVSELYTIFTHETCRIETKMPVDCYSENEGDLFRMWVMRSKYFGTSEDLVFTDDALFQARCDCSEIRKFLEYLLKNLEDFDFSDTNIQITNNIHKHVLSVLHKTNTKIQRSYDVLDLNLVHEQIFQSINNLSAIYLPMMMHPRIFDTAAQKVLSLIFDTFVKLLVPFLPFLTEEMYRRMSLLKVSLLKVSLLKASCIDSQLFGDFPVTKDEMNKEEKQMWESLEKLRILVEKEKNRIKVGEDVELKLVMTLDVGSCCDNHAIQELVSLEKTLLLVLSTYFGVCTCSLEFVQDETRSSFSKNLKQASTISVVPLQKQ